MSIKHLPPPKGIGFKQEPRPPVQRSVAKMERGFLFIDIWDWCGVILV